MSQYDDAFDDTYKAMFEEMEKPYKKYYIPFKKGDNFSYNLAQALTQDELQKLFEELESLINRKGPIRCNGFSGDLSEPLRRVRYSAYSVPGIGWFDEKGFTPISSKKQYKALRDELLKAIENQNESK